MSSSDEDIVENECGNITAKDEAELSDEDGAVEKFRRFMANKFSFLHKNKNGLDGPRILEETTINGIVKYIKDGRCKYIITMAGAGISTSSGIPDFRSPGSGLYHNLEKYKLPEPQSIFEIDFFHRNPLPFFSLAQELYPGSFKPTVCHYFIRLLQEKGLLLRHYTQNIDTLERVAGLPECKIIEAHGSFHNSHCLICRKEYSIGWMKERIFSDIVPTCINCKGIVKPDIVFFGESLPKTFFDNVEKDFSKCDLLIVMGSSLTVQPFASLIHQVPINCPRLLVNRQKMEDVIDFDSNSNTRDVAWLGDCDDGCKLIADKLGWGDELKEIVKSEHKKINDGHELPTRKLE